MAPTQASKTTSHPKLDRQATIPPTSQSTFINAPVQEKPFVTIFFYLYHYGPSLFDDIGTKYPLLRALFAAAGSITRALLLDFVERNERLTAGPVDSIGQ